MSQHFSSLLPSTGASELSPRARARERAGGRCAHERIRFHAQTRFPRCRESGARCPRDLLTRAAAAVLLLLPLLPPPRPRNRFVVSRVPSISAAATLLGSRRSPSFSPFHFPGCPFTRAPPRRLIVLPSVARTRAHSRLRYRARSSHRSDPQAGSGERHPPLVWHGPHSTRGVETGSGPSRTGVALATTICFNPRSIIGLLRRSKALYYSGLRQPLSRLFQGRKRKGRTYVYIYIFIDRERNRRAKFYVTPRDDQLSNKLTANRLISY